MKVMFKDREVSGFEVDGIHAWDYPDFCDAYICYAEYEDGTPLTEDELDALHDANSDLVHELAHQRWN